MAPLQIAVSMVDMNFRMRKLALISVALLAALLTMPAIHAQTFTVLHYFSGGADGGVPLAGLAIDRNGNLFGVTNYGGNSSCFSGGDYRGCGVAFKLSLHGSDWILLPLYEFQGGSDGAYPVADLTIAGDGSVYGTTSAGGTGQCTSGDGCGTVFHLRPAPNRCAGATCPWNETVLYRFTGGNDGGNAQSNVLLDNAGNLYGTTYQGGASGEGVAFELQPSQGGWTESVIHPFAGGSDGAVPQGNLIVDANGNLYGTTEEGGASTACQPYGCGTAFELTDSGSGWQENVLYAFQGESDGAEPIGGVSFDTAGNLYGSNLGNNGIFQLSFSHGSWNLTPLYSNLGFGGLPAVTNPPIADAAGNLYGTTVFGGSGCIYGCGVVFKLTPTMGGWTYTVLHQFDYNDGQAPWGRLVMDGAGNLYGTTVQGGSGNCPQLCGTVWKITP